ncbi:hypothetical protein D9M68_888850 [compost metagenome]
MPPAQLDLQHRGQPVEQLDIDPGELMLTTVELRVRRLQQHAHAQLRVRLQPVALRLGKGRGCRFIGRPHRQGQAGKQ